MNKQAAANYKPTHIDYNGHSYTAYDADYVIHAGFYEPRYKLGRRLPDNASLEGRCKRVDDMVKKGIRLSEACTSCLVTQAQYKTIYPNKKPKVKFDVEYYLKYRNTKSLKVMAYDTRMSYSAFCKNVRNYKKGNDL